MQRARPPKQPFRKLVAFERSEDPPKSIVRGNAARERKESLEPLLACFAEQLDVRPVFRTAQHRQNRDGDYVQQPMVAATDHSRIFQVPETRLQTTKEIPGRVVHDRAVPGTRPRRSRLAAGLRTAFLRNVLASRSLRPAFDAPALLGSVDVVLCMTAMGSIGRDASTIVTMEVIQSWNLDAVIMSGIAFGKDATKQQIGNVLISERIISYEPQRVGAETTQDRGSQPSATPVLLNRFRNVVGWSFSSPDGRSCGFQDGPILSGEKLVDNLDLKTELFNRYPSAIGGEMEGAGFAAAAERGRCEWIVVKAICDWGDGTKVSQHQEFAAASSVDLIEHVLSQPGALARFLAAIRNNMALSELSGRLAIGVAASVRYGGRQD